MQYQGKIALVPEEIVFQNVLQKKEIKDHQEALVHQDQKVRYHKPFLKSEIVSFQRIG